jgi:hypothetical protein
MNVRDGLTENGQPIHSSTEDAWARLGETSTTPDDPSASSDAAEHDAATIKEALRNPETTLDLASGITTPANPQTPLEDVHFEVEGEKLTAGQVWGALNDAATQLETLEAEHSDLQAETAYADFQDSIDAAEDEADLVEALTTLRPHIDDETYRLAVEEAADVLVGTDDPDELRAAARDLDTAVALRVALEGQAVEEGLRAKLAETRVEQTRDEIRDWQLERGLTPEQARQRLEVINRACIEDYGHDLECFAANDPELFGKLLRAQGAAIDSVTKEVSDLEIRQGVLDAPSTSISEGLTQITPFGEMYLQPRPELELRQERVDARAVATARPRESAESIKASLLAGDENSIADGFTRDGSPVSADVASDGPARRAFEEAARLDRPR